MTQDWVAILRVATSWVEFTWSHGAGGAIWVLVFQRPIAQINTLCRSI